MRLEILEDLYKQKLAELYDAEKQLLRFLPKLSRAVAYPEWQGLFEKHIPETRTHCQRLEALMAKHGVEGPKRCKALGGLIAAAKDLLKEESSDPQIVALALASAAQDVEGFEITCYASAHTFARLLGFHEDLRPLEQTFQEEKHMEDGLVSFAESLGAEEMESETEGQPTHLGQT